MFHEFFHFPRSREFTFNLKKIAIFLSNKQIERTLNINRKIFFRRLRASRYSKEVRKA